MLRPRIRHLLLLMIATMAFMPAVARADVERISPSYSASPVTVMSGGGTPIDCQVVWSGGTDGAGNFYSPCGTSIFILSPTGAFTGSITMPAQYTAIRDVAANADGTIVYAVTADKNRNYPPSFSPLQYPDVGKIIRFIKSPSTGAWSFDAGFHIDPIEWLGGSGLSWTIRNVSVAGNGHIFATSNAYVREYSPTGSVISTFGAESLGDVATGLQASFDGNHVWVVVESHASNVQHWYRSADGAWHRSSVKLGSNPVGGVIGSLTEYVYSNCLPNIDDGLLRNPYDVSLDGAGNIYVVDTSCMRIRKYSASGAWRTDVWRNYYDNGPLYHGFAVNWQGNIFVPEMSRVFVRSGLPGALDISCAPDSDAPRFTRLGRPSWTYERTVRLDVAATDRCSRVTGMRVTGDVVGGGSWMSAAPHTITLTPGSRVKQLTVTIRDTYGHLTTQRIQITYSATLPVPRRSIRLSSSSACAARPQTFLRSGGWRVADACATYTGTVTQIVRSRSTVRIRVLVPFATARRMFLNAHGDVPVWIVGSRSTPHGKALRVGSRARITSTLVVDRSGRTLSGAPTWRWGRI